MANSFPVRKFLFATIAGFQFTACKNAGDIIPAADETSFPQPAPQTLKFDSATTIDWPGKLSPLTPTEKKISYEKFPQHRFDSAGYQPFLKKPLQTPFDFNALPDTTFNYDALPSLPLRYETFVVGPPQIVKARKPLLKQPKNGQIFSLGEPLAGRQVQCSFQSKDGMIWIANDRGLYRYDGENYALYIIPGKNIQVFHMNDDADGRLWVTTAQNGLYIFDFRMGVTMHIGQQQGLLSNTVINLLFDDARRAWITCVPRQFNPSSEISVDSGGGVSIVDFEAKTIKNFTTAQGFPKNAGSGIVQDHQGNIWIGTLFGSLAVVNVKEKKLKRPGIPEGLVTNLTTDVGIDANGRIWVSGWYGNLSIIDLQAKRITNIGEEQGIPNIFMSTLAGDDKGNMWIGCVSYLCSINEDLTGMKVFNSKNGLDGTNNGAVLFSRNKKIWVSTTDGPNFISTEETAPRYINTKDISTMSEDQLGRIWIGFLGANGVQIVDTTTGEAKSFTETDGLSDNAVQSIMPVGDDMWIASLERGIDVVNTSNNKLLHIGVESGLRNNEVLFTSIDKAGNAWAGYNNIAGIDRIHLQNKTIYHLGRDQGFRDSVIIDVKQNKDGTFWFSSYINGVGLIDTAAKTIKHITNIPALQVGGRNNYVLLLPDPAGNLWIATKSGLVMINESKNSFIVFTTKEGLTDNVIFSIGERNGNIYAGTTNGLNVISKTSSGRWQVSTIADNFDGIAKNAGSYNSDLVTKKGDYWWGDQGITIIPASTHLKIDSQSATLAITGFDLLGKAQQFADKPIGIFGNQNDTLWSSTKDTFYLHGNYPVYNSERDSKWDSVIPPYNLPKNLALPYHKNYLQFHYLLRQPGNNDTIIYRYFLQGIDQAWSDRTKNTNTENYLNLPPGDYAFKVIAFTNGGWTEPAVFEFRINPPWWRTWLAYLIYVFIGGVVIWGFVKYRSRRLKWENQRLEQTVSQRTDELRHSLDELKATQSQLIQSEKMASLGELTAGIAHEIQNPLNFVNNFSEVNTELAAELKEEIDKLPVPEQTKKELAVIIDDMVQNQDKITFHGKRADAIVKGMLQHSRGGSGQKEPTDLNALADEYLRLSYHGLRAKDKSFNADIKTEFDNSLPLVTIVSQEIGRALLNLFTNAFYSVTQKKALVDAGYKPTLEVSTKRIGNKVQIRVKDNGMGVPQRILDKIFQPFFTTKPTGEGTGLGLSLTYDIITKAHGGELKVETKEGEGAEFIILLPL